MTCANDKGCAERTVQGYMNKWQTDCNGDGLIDCSDFAAIHKLGLTGKPNSFHIIVISIVVHIRAAFVW